MTAPLKHADTTVVDVALGDRAYDIVIGRDVLASLGRARCSASAGRACRDRHRPDRRQTLA